VSILQRYGIIAFGSDGRMIPGPNAIVISEEEAAELRAKAKAPVGEGG
jgi:hypothetical protein